MRLARLDAGQVEFADLVEIFRHYAASEDHDDLVRFAFAAVAAIEQQLGELSVAAFLAEVVPLTPTDANGSLALADRESQALAQHGQHQRSVAAGRGDSAEPRCNAPTADPTNAQAQRDLSVSYERLGDLLLRLGDSAQAERHYRDSLTIPERLATTDPTNAEAQRDLSVSYNKLGDLLLRLGDGAQAERHYRDSLTIRERLATTDPTNAQAQRDLSVSYNKLGDLLLRLGDGAAGRTPLPRQPHHPRAPRHRRPHQRPSPTRPLRLLRQTRRSAAAPRRRRAGRTPLPRQPHHP